MNKLLQNTNVLIGGGIVLLVIVGFVLFRMVGGSRPVEDAAPTPTPTPAYQDVEDVEAEVTLQANGVYVDIVMTGLDSRFEKVEYELSYDTDTGPKGVIGSVVATGKDEIEREERLGTCSTGGKCTDHKGVENFKLTAKFHAEDGEIYILREEFDEM